MIGDDDGDSIDGDATDYTIWLPFPVIHLLRQEDVLDAVTSGYNNMEMVLWRNKARMRRHDIETCVARLKTCCEI